MTRPSDSRANSLSSWGLGVAAETMCRISTPRTKSVSGNRRMLLRTRVARNSTAGPVKSPILRYHRGRRGDRRPGGATRLPARQRVLQHGPEAAGPREELQPDAGRQQQAGKRTQGPAAEREQPAEQQRQQDQEHANDDVDKRRGVREAEPATRPTSDGTGRPAEPRQRDEQEREEREGHQQE